MGRVAATAVVAEALAEDEVEADLCVVAVEVVIAIVPTKYYTQPLKYRTARASSVLILSVLGTNTTTRYMSVALLPFLYTKTRIDND